MSWYPYSSSTGFVKSPEQVALSEALRFYKIPGPGSSRRGEVEATGPTKCITHASTIGSIQGEARAVRYVVVHEGVEALPDEIFVPAHPTVGRGLPRFGV